jgi:two-component system, chemotaxis family, chemotaxis protein CheY
MSAGPKVLVVDDDAGVRRALRELLEDDGFDVVGEAADGGQAVAAVGKLGPDLVLMDLRMPFVDGIEATRRIRTMAPNVQVIVCTAYDDATLEANASHAGAFMFLVKGCMPGAVLDSVARAWSHKQDLDRVGR